MEGRTDCESMLKLGLLRHSVRDRPTDGAGELLARATLADGRTRTKFQRICEPQGGMCTTGTAKHRHLLLVTSDGQVVRTDNRKLARLTKLAGVPVAHADIVGIIPG